MSRQGHLHICACGTYYTCQRNPDQCAREWTCPACEDDQRDDYFRQAELATPTHPATNTHKETR